jgi:outer membrane immunogenic protein
MYLKKQLLLSAAVGVLATATPAMAAPPPMPFTWTGYYAGANAGYSWGQGTATYNEAFGFPAIPDPISGSNHLNGAIGGLQAGYNWQTGAWVWGLETDLQLADEKASRSFSYPYAHDCEGTCTLSGSLSSAIDWFGTARVRLGWLATPTTLVFGTGGLAYGRVSAAGNFTDNACTPACMWSFDKAAINVGWTVGGGVEAAVPGSTNWTWKVEYLYIDLGSLSGSGFDTDFGEPYSWNAKFTDNILRFGLNWHFH